jgi:murein DD-endopeptidase MepM/ murein hydrolase activator NlpD
MFSRQMGWVVLFMAAVAVAGCRPASAIAVTTPPAEPSATATVAPPTPTEPMAAPAVPADLTALPIASPPRPTAQPTEPAPAPPPVEPTADPGAGLPCPIESPVKPDYARGGVGATVWPTGDAGRTSPHLWLAAPVIVEGPPRINRAFPYGWDSDGRYLLHNGLDIVEPPGSPLLAPADGTVVVAGPDAERQFGWRCDWYGQLVVVELDERWDGQLIYVLYGHVLEIAVTPGQRVREGDPLAVIGFGGVATTPHLHLEVRIGDNSFGATRNPALWLRPEAGYGVVAGRLVDPDGRPWQGVTMTLIDPTGAADFLYTWTYLDDPVHLIQPDEALGENFAWAAIPAGEYDVFARVQGRDYRQRVSVVEGQVGFVELVTDAYQTPTPTASEAAPAATP